MTIVKQANFDVTAALLRGQHAIGDAIEAYRNVLEAETRLIRDADTPEEREIAQRGIGAAQTTLAILRALDGKYDGSAHQFGAEPGELPHERLIKLATKLASRIDMPWQYKLTCQYAEALENIVPTAPEGKGWELVSSSVLKRGSVGVGFRYEVFFTWRRK